MNKVERGISDVSAQTQRRPLGSEKNFKKSNTLTRYTILYNDCLV